MTHPPPPRLPTYPSDQDALLEELVALPSTELKRQLKDYGLPTGGPREGLAKRLADHIIMLQEQELEQQRQQQEEEEATG